MPTSLGTFKTNLYGPLGRNDSVAAGFITQGVNFACTLISLLYDPPELQTSSSITVAASTTTASTSSLTRLANIMSIYNYSAGNKKVWMLPYPLMELLSPIASAAESKYFKFYGRHGSNLYFRPWSVYENILTVFYNQYPVAVSVDGDQISFSNYDPMVESYALAYAQACLDEFDAAGMWKTLGDAIGAPQQVMLKARQYLEGGPAHGNDTSGTTT